MELVDHMLIRIANLSLEDFAKMEFTKSSGILVEIRELKQRRNEFKEKLVHKLFELISTTQNVGIRNRLLNLKRDIYNNRKIELKSSLPISFTEIEDNIAAFIRLNEAIASFEKSGEKTYKDQIHSNRELLRVLLQNEKLSNGILSSSITFFDFVAEYQKKQGFNGKDFLMEVTLFKYISRMTFKTNPFSSFTSINIFKHQEQVKDSKMVIFGTDEFKEKLSVNSGLLKYFLTILWNDFRTAKGLNLDLNHSFEIGSNKVKFLANNNNREFLKSLEIDHTLRSILDFMIIHPNGVRISSLLEFLKEQTGEPSYTIWIFVRSLIEIDLLQVRFGISSSDPTWPIKLISLLESLREYSGIADTILNTFYKIHGLTISYSSLDSKSRRIKIEEAFIELRAMIPKLEEELAAAKSADEVDSIRPLQFPFIREHIYFNESIRDISISVNSERLNETVNLLSRFIEKVSWLSSTEAERGNLRRFYLANYNSEMRIPVLQFCSDLWKLGDTTNHNKNANVDFDNLLSRSGLRIKNESSEQVDLCFEHNTPNTLSDPVSKSYGAFLQFFSEQDATSEGYGAVVNNIFLGYGKMLSRYLHHFSDGFIESQRRFNKPLDINIIHAELHDSSFFNGNVHQPLTDIDIWIPGSSLSPLHPRTIPVNRLLINYNSKTDSLEMTDGSNGRKVHPLNLTFQSISARSPLFRLLSSLSPFSSLNYRSVLDRLNTYYVNFETGVTLQKRLTLEGQLTLERKRWIVPEKIVPQRGNSSDWHYFLTINDWVLNHGLPSTCFVSKLIKNGEGALVNFGEKPQYMDFTNPHLISLFQKTMRLSTDCFLQIQELSPKPSEMFTINKRRYATEFLVQWRQ